MRQRSTTELVLVGIIWIAWILACGGDVAPRGSTRSAALKPSGIPNIEIEASALVAEYTENEIAADQRFKGNTLAVTGVIDSIGKDILGSPYISMTAGPNSFRHVQALFDRRDENRLAELRKGQKVTVHCVGKGLLMNVLLDRCQLRTAGL